MHEKGFLKTNPLFGENPNKSVLHFLIGFNDVDEILFQK